MEKVTIYQVTCDKGYYIGETGTGWSLRGWGGNTDCYSGWDDGGCDYLLPEGFSAGEDKMGLPHIYTDDNYPVPIIGTHAPTLINPDTGRYVALKKIAE